MQIGKPRSPGTSTTPEQQEELLDCRMAMLGLQFNPTTPPTPTLSVR